MKMLLVVLERAFDDAVPGDNAEDVVVHGLVDHSPLLVAVVVVALALLAPGARALLGAVVHAVVLQLLPAVAQVAAEGARAPVSGVVSHEPFELPVGARLSEWELTMGW